MQSNHMERMHMWSSFKILIEDLRLSTVTKNRKLLSKKNLRKIFSSETTEPIATKLWWNGPWMAPFQNSVR